MSAMKYIEQAALGSIIGRESVESMRTTSQLAAMILGEYSSVVIDVGARWGAEESWWRCKPLAKLIGFEPEASECARLNSKCKSAEEEFVPLALGKETSKLPFYQAVEPGCSSIYRPKQSLIPKFYELKVLEVEAEVEVDVVALDAWAKNRKDLDVSFIKLDTQGSELDILRGGQQVLQGCLGLEVEVQFMTMYEGAPDFADVDCFLREQGFVLWRLNNLCHYTSAPTNLTRSAQSTHYDGANVTSAVGCGRLTWGDAIYFRDLHDSALIGKHPKALLKLASLFDGAGDTDATINCLQKVVDYHASQLSNENVAMIEEQIVQLQALLVC